MWKCHTLGMAMILLAGVARAEGPGELAVFGDWTIGCDNTRACTAVSLQSDEVGDGNLQIVIERGPKETDPPLVSFRLGGDSSALAATATGLIVEGRLVSMSMQSTDGIVRFTKPETAGYSFIVLTAKLGDIALAGSNGAPIDSASLKGLGAAISHMDREQKRADGPTAIALRRNGGPLPPPPPHAHVIRRPPETTKAPRTLDEAETERLRLAHGPDCRRPQRRDHLRAPVFQRLDDATTLALIDPICAGGAYNRDQIVLLVDETGQARRATLERAMYQDQPQLAVNPWWDKASRSLGSQASGRGLGDCGLIQEHVWDGKSFRLARQREMSPCRGSTVFIQTWHAEVVDR
jgi:Protein of unknown function (DUF1176)